VFKFIASISKVEEVRGLKLEHAKLNPETERSCIGIYNSWLWGPELRIVLNYGTIDYRTVRTEWGFIQTGSGEQ
jgi:hypothetical protein